MLEGLAGQAASTGRRTGSCCCTCCRSAISVGEAWWSGPLGLPQCRTAPLHCLSASRQLFYTVSVPPDSSSTLSQCLPTALLNCLSASRQLFYTVSVPPDSSSTLSQYIQTVPLLFTHAKPKPNHHMHILFWMCILMSIYSIALLVSPTGKCCRLIARTPDSQIDR